MIRLLALTSAALLAVAAPAVACSASWEADVPLRMEANHLIVTVSINNADVDMILDTGAGRTMVTEDTARHLGLRVDEWRSSTTTGLGGSTSHRDAALDSIAIAARPLRYAGPSSEPIIAVGVLGFGGPNGHRFGGLLGADYLSSYDIDLDIRNLSMTMYSVAGCTGSFIPWQGAYQRVPVNLSRGRYLAVRAYLDDNPVSAILDTGASITLVSAAAAARGGVTADVLSQDPAGTIAGVGSGISVTHAHRFAELRLGDAVFPKVTLAVSDFHVITEMLIGLDFLSSRRLWLSYATSQVFLQ